MTVGLMADGGKGVIDDVGLEKIFNRNCWQGSHATI
jgi:hypothetical protein